MCIEILTIVGLLLHYLLTFAWISIFFTACFSWHRNEKQYSKSLDGSWPWHFQSTDTMIFRCDRFLHNTFWYPSVKLFSAETDIKAQCKRSILYWVLNKYIRKIVSNYIIRLTNAMQAILVTDFSLEYFQQLELFL